jgi:hypothetical protein
VSKLFENRYARADRIRLEPGIALPDHRAGFRAVYALGEFDLDVRTGDRTVQHHLTPGEVITWPAGHYSIVNSGEAVASFVVVSPTGAMPTTDPGTDDSDDTIEPDLQWEKLVFSSNQVDVMEATMEPGEEHPLSSRHPALVYALTPAAVEFRSASGEAVSTGINEGGVAWLEPEVSVAENTGNETARLAMFHFK